MVSAPEVRQEPEKPPSTEDLYKQLAEEGPLRPGIATAKSNIDVKNSDLYDPKLIAEGKEFVRRHYASVVVSHLIVMMWALAIKYIRLLILHNDGGYAEDHAKTRSRYLISILRIMKWFDGDYDTPASSSNTTDILGFSSTMDLETVRKIHYLVAKNHKLKPKPVLPKLTPKQEEVLKAVRKEMEGIDMSVAPDYVKKLEDPAIPLSQFPMAAAQALFMGLVGAFPEKFGMPDTNGLDGYVHLWAIIGRQLGVDDQFNWALYYKKTKSLAPVKDLYQKFILPSLKVMDETSIIMVQDFIDGVADYVLVIRFLPVLKYMLTVCELEGSSLDHLMDWKDRLSYWFIKINLHVLHKYRLTRIFQNWLIRMFLLYGSRRYLPANFRKYE